MIEVTQGSLPIVLGIPHSGTLIPNDLVDKLSEAGQALVETDWHIDRLYNGLGVDVSVVRTPVHRYILDVDHPPSAPGPFPLLQASGLFPLTDRNGTAIYHENAAPSVADMADRIEQYHTPYHEAISAELLRLKTQHGVALLFDCHSISAFNPQIDAIELPDFNIWTNLSKACAPSVEKSIYTRCRAAEGFETRLSAGTTGGWSVAKHGKPARNIHAVRLELAQSTYMDDAPPWHWRPDKAERVRSILYRVLSDLTELLHERSQR